MLSSQLTNKLKQFNNVGEDSFHNSSVHGHWKNTVCSNDELGTSKLPELFIKGQPGGSG